MIDTILERTVLIQVSPDVCHGIEDAFCLAVTSMYSTKSLGFCCFSILELEIVWISKGNVLVLTCCRICLAGDDDFGQEHCTKMFST